MPFAPLGGAAPPIGSRWQKAHRNAFGPRNTLRAIYPNKKGRPMPSLVLPLGLEPRTPTLRVSCSTN